MFQHVPFRPRQSPHVMDHVHHHGFEFLHMLNLHLLVRKCVASPRVFERWLQQLRLQYDRLLQLVAANKHRLLWYLH